MAPFVLAKYRSTSVLVLLQHRQELRPLLIFFIYGLRPLVHGDERVLLLEAQLSEKRSK